MSSDVILTSKKREKVRKNPFLCVKFDEKLDNSL